MKRIQDATFKAKVSLKTYEIEKVIGLCSKTEKSKTTHLAHASDQHASEAIKRLSHIGLQEVTMDSVEKILFKAKRFFAFIIILFLVYTCLSNRPAIAYPSLFSTGTTIYLKQKFFSGYTLYRAFVNGQKVLLLIDMQGNVAHMWQKPDSNLGYAEPLSNGNVLAFSYAAQGGIVELDWNSNVVWQYNSPIGLPHQDFERLENGNTLILYKDVNYVPEISDKLIEDDFIVEVDPSGQIVWQWRTSEHFNEFGFDNEAKTLIYNKGKDWAHTNSIQSLPYNNHNDPRFKKGNILVSQRNTNLIFIIDKDTGQIVWKAMLSLGQHDAKMIPQGFVGAGNILLFDNGGTAGYPSLCRQYSRVIEVDPITLNIVWEYNALSSGRPLYTFFSSAISGAQRLPNGNTLIVEGLNGRLFEVTYNGEIVWEYVNPYFKNDIELGISNAVYRAWRVPLAWPQWK